MVPLVFLMWQSDATARLALEQSAQASITSLGQGALVTGGEAGFDALALSPSAAYGLQIRGLYGRVVSFSSSGDHAPADNISAQLSGDASVQVTPRLRLSVDTEDFLASRYGVRATDPLAARDPFIDGDRLEYAIGGGLGLHASTSQRSMLRVTADYTQAGALTATFADAVGVDTHAPRGSAAVDHELGPNDAITPEVRYSFTHYYHAIYSAGPGGVFHRGPLDIHAVTGLVGETHAFDRRLLGEVSLGVTAASPPPTLSTRAPVIAPEVAVSLRYFAARYQLHAEYTYGYTSLGPRVGFGFEHQGHLEVSFRPVRGARYRDLQLVGIGRAGFGESPALVNANASAAPGAGAMAPSSTAATLRTITVAAGGRLDYPIRRGLAFVGAVDLQFVRGSVDPAPRGELPESQLQMVATIGIAGVLSTDPYRTVLRDPEEEEEEVRRGQRGALAPLDRLERRGRGERDPEPRDEDVEDDQEREPSSSAVEPDEP